MLCKVINGALRHNGVRYPRGAEVELSQERCEALAALGVISVIEQEPQPKTETQTEPTPTQEPQQAQEKPAIEAPKPKRRGRGRRKKQ